MYILRNAWGPEQIHFALHCSPPAISGHDQPDNGTFELYAYGRWLMPDTGYYTYGHDQEARAWHRQTRVHQTLTRDGQDARVQARQLLWKTGPTFDAVAVENASYAGLTHRRTVWFVDRSFFVFLDEALGGAEGDLDLHFQLAPGLTQVDCARLQARTRFADANVLVWMDPRAPVTLTAEDGWFAWKYGQRERRQALRYRHARQAPVTFLTLVIPFRGHQPPAAATRLPADFEPGAARVALQVSAGDESWAVGRDLQRQDAWCVRND
jgi:heparan-sulfate lyase